MNIFDFSDLIIILVILGVAFFFYPKMQTMHEEVCEENLSKLKALSGYLEQLESDFSNLFLRTPDLMFFVNADGIFTKANPAFTVYLGWSNLDLIDRSIFDFIHPEDTERTRQMLENLKKEDQVGFVVRFRASDDSYKNLQWSLTSFNSYNISYAIARAI